MPARGQLEEGEYPGREITRRTAKARQICRGSCSTCVKTQSAGRVHLLLVLPDYGPGSNTYIGSYDVFGCSVEDGNSGVPGRQLLSVPLLPRKQTSAPFRTPPAIPFPTAGWVSTPSRGSPANLPNARECSARVCAASGGSARTVPGLRQSLRSHGQAR